MLEHGRSLELIFIKTQFEKNALGGSSYCTCNRCCEGQTENQVDKAK